MLAVSGQLLFGGYVAGPGHTGKFIYAIAPFYFLSSYVHSIISYGTMRLIAFSLARPAGGDLRAYLASSAIIGGVALGLVGFMSKPTLFSGAQSMAIGLVAGVILSMPTIMLSVMLRRGEPTSESPGQRLRHR